MEEMGFYYESIGRRIVHEQLRKQVAIPTETIVRERRNID
jgi:hypothetical protein